MAELFPAQREGDRGREKAQNSITPVILLTHSPHPFSIKGEGF